MSGLTFKTRPSELRDPWLAIKLWAKPQAIAVGVAVVVGALTGDAALAIFTAMAGTIPAIVIANNRLPAVTREDAGGLPKVGFDGKQVTIPLGGGRTAVFYVGSDLRVDAGWYFTPNVTQGGTARGAWLRLVQGDKRALLIGDGGFGGAEEAGVPQARVPAGEPGGFVRMFPEDVVALWGLVRTRGPGA